MFKLLFKRLLLYSDSLTKAANSTSKDVPSAHPTYRQESLFSVRGNWLMLERLYF